MMTAIRKCNRGPVKTPQEIEAAHDLILMVSAVCSEAIEEDEKACLAIGMALNVLCWALGHEGAGQTQEMLNRFAKIAERLEIEQVTGEELRRRNRQAWTN